MEEEKCKTGHVIDGIVPLERDNQYDGRTCDCQRLIYYSEACSCSDGGGYKLRSRANENHIS